MYRLSCAAVPPAPVNIAMRPYTPATLFRTYGPQESAPLYFPLSGTYSEEEGDDDSCLEVKEPESRRERSEAPFRPEGEFHGRASDTGSR